MTRRDDAIDAICDALDNHGHNGIDCRPNKPLDVTAEAVLDAALAVLQPTVPNTAEMLHDLPVGTIVRADGAAYVHTDAWEWAETVTGTAWTADELAARRPYWHAIHTPQETE